MDLSRFFAKLVAVMNPVLKLLVEGGLLERFREAQFTRFRLVTGGQDAALVREFVRRLDPKHPRLAEYTKPHTKAWSATISAADAFVFVIPEYNHGAPPSLLNAIDFLYNEWLYKPCAFVSYGGPAMGARSVGIAKLKAVALKMMPMFESVGIPFIIKQVANGVFQPNEQNEKAATAMLDELLRWAEALKILR